MDAVRTRTLPIVLSCLLSVMLAAGCRSDESPKPVDSIPAIGFVEKFAPVVHLHKDERLFPLAAESFIDHAKLLWADGEIGARTIAVGSALNDGSYGEVQTIDPERLGDRATGIAYEQRLDARPGCPNGCAGATSESSDDTRPFKTDRNEELLRPGEGFYLDLNNDLIAGNAPARPDETPTVRAPAYPEILEEGSKRQLVRATYWMLFGAEQQQADGIEQREGDWERISVLLRKADRGARYEPVHVRYYQPSGPIDVPWESVEVVEGGPGKVQATHPVVYLGRGNHTPYPEPTDETRTVRYDSSPIEIHEQAEACDHCPVWRTWSNLVDVETQPWYSFGGAWGRIGDSSDDSGPPGPSVFVDP